MCHKTLGSIVIIKEKLEAMLELLCLEEEVGDPKDPGTVVHISK